MILVDPDRLGAAVEGAVRDVQGCLHPDKRLAGETVQFVAGYILGRIHYAGRVLPNPGSRTVGE